MIPIKDTIPRYGFPVITWTLILLNGIIFIFEISVPRDVLENLIYFFGLIPSRYASPGRALDYMPFLTNMFLHGGWLHIIGNMWFLNLFGSTVEDRMGYGRFLAFYLLSGIFASVIYYIADIHSTIPAFGASGAIAGVMGAYIVMFPKARILTLIPIFFFPLFVELSAFVYIGFWFLLQLFSGTLSLGSPATGGGIAWWGHIGGFIAGILLLPLFGRRQLSYRKTYPDETYHYLNR